MRHVVAAEAIRSACRRGPLRDAAGGKRDGTARHRAPVPGRGEVIPGSVDRTDAASSTLAMIWSAALRHDETVVALGLEALDAAEPSGGFSAAWGLARVAAELIGRGRKLTVGVSTDEEAPSAPEARPATSSLRVEVVIDPQTALSPAGGGIVESTEIAASLLAAASRRDLSGALDLWRALDTASRAAMVCELVGLGLVALAEDIVPRA
jgi:hypothetical protein